MLGLGVILGILTAWGHSLAYLASRWFTVGRRGTSRQLLVVAHLQLGLLSVAAMPWLWPAGLGWSWAWFGPALAGAVVLAGSQASLFGALRHADASVVSPLLSAKIAVLAAVTTLGLYGESRHVSALGWLGVALAIAGALLIQGIGQRPPARALAWVTLTLLGYAFCDLSIVQTIHGVLDHAPTLSEAGENSMAARVHAGAFVATLLYTGAGLIALAFSPWYGSRRARVWRDALPYTASWSVAMVSLYATFALLGAVYAVILQSTRALWSVLLGGVVGRLGDGKVETNHRAHVLGWRVLGAAMMVAAVALFAWSRA